VSGREYELLSREELDALLSQVHDPATDPHEDFFGAAADDARLRGRLASALPDFASEEARRLSTEFQRPIEIESFGVERVTRRQFAAATIELDEVASLDLQPDNARGALLIGRSMFFGWLCMVLGGQTDLGLGTPDRANSAIERRFLRHLAGELVAQLERCLAGVPPVRIAVRDLVAPGELLGDPDERLCLASFDVRGFGDVARLRLALPSAWLERLESDASPAARASGSAAVNELVKEVPLRLRAEIGAAELSVRRLVELREGDTLALEPPTGGQVLVRLEDTARFTATPGSVGSRLAIRLVDEV